MVRVDTEIFRSINNLAGQSARLDAFGIFSAKYLIWIMAGIVLAGAVIEETRLNRRGGGLWARLSALVCRCRDEALPGSLTVAAVRCALAALAAYLANFVFGLLLFRPRPCGVLYQVHNLLHRTCTDKSFPSDHASMAFAMAFSVVFLRPLLGSALLVMAAFVGWGRIFVGVHYPADVLAGALAGLIWALIVRAVESRTGLTGELRRSWQGFLKAVLHKT